MSEVSSIADLEQELEQYQYRKARKLMAERLANNSDFRKIVLEGFCRDDCARYVSESGDPLLGAEERKDALNIAQAAGHFKRYMRLQIQMGETADRNIRDLEEAISEVRAEGANL